MTTAELLNQLRELGVQLRVADGELKVSAPQGTLTPELRADLRGRKAELIELLSIAGSPAAATRQIPPADRLQPIPLSYAQQRIWFLEEFEGGSSIYNIPWAMRVTGELDKAALQQAIDAVVARHESLRTVFLQPDQEPEQKILPGMSILLETLSMPGATDADIRSRLETWSRESFDLATGPLFRVRLIEVSPTEYVLMMVMHHIISDAWSLDVLQTELFGAYLAASRGEAPQLPPMPLQFADFAAWQRRTLQGAELDRQLAYWQQQLAGAAPLLELPTDRSRPSEQSFRGARVRKILAPELRDRLKALAKGHNATLFMVLLAAFDILLARYSRQDDIIVGTPIAGRQDTQLEGLIGLFVNSLVMRADLADNPRFTDLLAQVQATALDAYAHQELPFDRVVEALRPARDLSYSPVYQVQFNLQNAPASGQPLPGLELSGLEFDYGTAKFDLSLATGETADGMIAEFEYATDLFDAATIERLLDHYERLLTGIVANPHTRIGDLPLLSEAEEQQILRDWNATAFDYPKELTMHGMVEQQAAAQPEAPALWAAGETLSYAELNRRANVLAHKLIELGAKPGVLIGICTERTVHMIPALLAIQKSGAAYVPVDPNYPPDRVRFMLEDSRAPILLTQDKLRADLPELVAELICLDSFNWDGADPGNPRNGVQASDLGYVIYTSGSTGKPKGVAIEHRNAVALMQWAGDVFGRAEFDGVLAGTSVCFDLSVYEIFVTLGQGGRVVLARDALQLAELPEDVNVTLINTVPSAIAELVRMNAIPASVRTVNLAGEPLSTQLVNDIYSIKTIKDVNDLYGPSEDTTYSTWTRREANAPPTVGRPIHNTQAYLLDQFGAPVPVGVPGELFLGGAGVTRGYLHRPELTAEKYVADPFSDNPHARLYRTGDKAKYRADGNIEFMGRLDHQVKLRGFRIELGEIEARLEKHKSVREAVVIVREDTPGDQRLVAYVVAETGSLEQLIGNGELNAWLAETLPAFMIPQVTVELDELPLTPNGKVDRKALPVPEYSAQQAEYVAPRNELEEHLAGIWQEVLHLDQVGIHDDFFALGGHSLLATRLTAAVRQELRLDIELRTLFRHPTIATLAGALAKAAALAGEAPIAHARHPDGAPLSYAQQRIYFLQQLDPAATVYNVPWAQWLKGPLEHAALQAAIDDLVARHESLRTVFSLQGESPRQYIRDDVRVPVGYVDLRSAGQADVEQRLTELAKEAFDLAAGPLLRVTVLATGVDEHILALAMHHIIEDARSLEIFFAELLTAYAARAAGRAPELPELPVSYADYASWQRGQAQGDALERDLDFWRDRLAGAPPALELPTDRPRPKLQTYVGRTLSRKIDSAVGRGIRALSSSHQATLFMTLQAVFSILLARYSRQNDVVMGTPVSGRSRTELENVIGFFLNTLVLRTDLSANPTFSELLAQTREDILEAFDHQDLPFEKLVEELQPVRDLSRSPLFQVLFTLISQFPKGDEQETGLITAPVAMDYEAAKFDLTLSLADMDGELYAAFEYNTDLFDAATIERLLDHYERLLTGIVADPQTRIGELPLLSEAEEQQILRDWNATAFDYPKELTMHGMVEQQAAAQPDAPALWAAGETLTYAELNRRANVLAHKLIALGAKPGVLIGICTERTVHMIPALLAIQKSGAAYVPVDPNYPPDRVRFMLEDSRAPILLTQDKLRADLPELVAELICLDSFNWDGADPGNPRNGVQASDLGYVIYTSGSTGKPKGVAIEHRNAVALMQWAGDVFERAEFDGVLAATSVCFDLSVYEIFVTLGQGGRVVLARDALQLAELPHDVNVTLINTVPSAIAELVRMQAIPPSVRTVNLAGEPLSTALVNDIYAVPTIEDVNDLYGPSEDTTYSTWTRREANAPPTVGKPIHNTQAYLLDQFGAPVPVGVPGELFLGGAGVTRGYLHRPELTAEKYVADPFSDDPAARLYRTGDKAKYRADGNIEFMGRLDHQVKLRGFRIELGEIEARLEQHPDIREAVAIVREDTPNDQRLVAYAVAEQDSLAEIINTGELNSWLAETLPAFMIPQVTVELDELPLTPNGKVDRKALPAPEYSTQQTEYVAPRNELEERLAEIWQEVLRVDRVGIHDDFFALGGHSLLAMRLTSRIRDRLQLELPLGALFEQPTIAGLANKFSSTQDVVALTRIERTGADFSAPLSYAQQRIYFLQQLDPGSTVYNLAWAQQLSGPLDDARLQTAIDALVARHESLRTVFREAGDEPVQQIAATLPLQLQREDMRTADQDSIRARLTELATVPFDLHAGPLIRFHLLHVGDNAHVLALSMHHIISDARSIDLVFAELMAFYNQATLPELTIQYADYAVWQREQLSGALLEQQLDYWRTRLAGAPPALELPTDRPRPKMQTYNGAVVSRQIGTATAGGIRRLAGSRSASLFMALQAVFSVLLARYARQDDVVIGTPVSGRDRTELENVIGFFLNTLVLRTDLSANPSFADLLEQVRTDTREAFAHQSLPFEKLVEDLQPTRDLSRSPLFQVLFTLVTQDKAKAAGGELQARPLFMDYQSAKFDLTLSVVDAGADLFASMEYNTDLFDAATIERMLDHYERLLAGIVANPQARIGDLPLLSEAEEQQILRDWNATGFDYPCELTMHGMFETQAAAQPEAPALWVGGNTLSYAELNRRANLLARHLIELGAGPGVMIGICAQRTADLIPSLYGILKSGAAYVPLDPKYPAERLRFMVEDSQAPILVTQSALLPALPEVDADVICLDQFDWDGVDPGNPDSGVSASDLGYVIYTSGSTGKPKGVAIEHRNAVALAQWAGDVFAAEKFAGVLGSTSVSFDLSVYEIFVTLGLGGRMVLVQDIFQLAELPAEANVGAIISVPSVIAEVLRGGGIPPSVHTVKLAGEFTSTPLVNDLYADTCIKDVIDLYGPSEDTTYSTWTRREPYARPTVGKPIHNTQVYILDQFGAPVPAGVPGELYLGGAGVTRGYLHRPELTAEKFVPDPFSDDPAARLYRTGDKGQFRPDGNIEFLGRLDFQVKLRGLRIELGEIEARLEDHPAVTEAVVLVREDTPGDQRLVAYVVSAKDSLHELIESGELNAWLAETLPAFMIPQVTVELDELPLTPNGKADRKALPVPEYSAQQTEYVAPRNELEERLAEIWQEVLRVDRVGIHDDFFALGGHSLLAMQLNSRVRDKLAAELSLGALFEFPTIALLANQLAVAEGEERIPRVGRDTPLPMSFAQQRLWFLDVMEPDSITYNVPMATEVQGEIDIAALQAAVDALVARHESFRTTFVNGEDYPVQIISKQGKQAQVAVAEFDMQGAADTAVRDKLNELWQQPFNLKTGPLLRIALLRCGDGRNIISACMHHIICDVWSQSLLFAELGKLYTAQRAGASPELPDLVVQYADYAVWQRNHLTGDELARQLDYWKESLAAAPPLLNLPLDKPRPAVETHRGATESLLLDKALAERLKKQAQASGCTLFALVLSAFYVLLGRYAGETDIVVGTPISGRRRSELEGIIGFFLNTLALRVDLSGNPSFRALLEQTKQATLGAFENQDVPFEMLVEELQPERNLSHAPIFQVLFVLNVGNDTASSTFGELPAAAAEFDFTAAKFDLQLTVNETPAGLDTSFLYNTDLFTPATMQRMLGHLRILLESIADNTAQAIAELPLLTDAERATVLADFNASVADYPATSVVALVEAQVDRQPDSIAVQSGASTLTYRELDERANALAHALIERGVAPGERVAVAMERSLHAPVAILAVLKAGAAYVPVDPEYPEERVQFMLADSGARVLLTQSSVRDKLRQDGIAGIAVGEFDWAAGNHARPAIEIAGRSPAYAIYTSGSTGLPKGVLLPHDGLANLVHWQLEQPGLNKPARTLQFASFSFDVSFQELFSTWAQGGTLVMIDEALRRDLPALARLIAAEQVERLFLPFAAMQPLVECMSGLDGLRVRDIVVAGEQLQITPAIRAFFTEHAATRLHNHYGPSETHVVTACTLTGDAAGWPQLPSIGTPVANTRAYVLDEQRQPVPINVPGELYIGGIQVALGYLNRPELDAEKFCPDFLLAPRHHGADEQPADTRLYRTGDRVRFRADGSLEYLGRTDDQVKWRGFRIEPGEIETALGEHEQVRQAAVLLREDEPGDKRLVAYLVADSGAAIDEQAVRRFLRERLPDYMVPTQFVVLDQLPLTPSGKIARRRLPQPATSRGDKQTLALPTTTAQKNLALLWQQLLKLDQVGIDDNFFDLGGHSLLTVKLTVLIEELTGEQLAIADVFENPTIREFSELLEDAEWGELSTEPAEPSLLGRLVRGVRGLLGRG